MWSLAVPSASLELSSSKTLSTGAREQLERLFKSAAQSRRLRATGLRAETGRAAGPHRQQDKLKLQEGTTRPLPQYTPAAQRSGAQAPAQQPTLQRQVLSAYTHNSTLHRTA